MRPKRQILHPATIAVGHDGIPRVAGAIVPPIFQTAQFEVGSSHEYTRISNPTVDIFERRVAQLERMEYGVAFASGMAALAALARVLSRRGPIRLMTGGYAGTLRLLRSEAECGALRWAPLEFATMEDLMDVRPPSSVWLESPSNPFLTEFSLATMITAVTRGVDLVVDNTLATPYLQCPAEHGVRHVVHSASKFLGGHSDLLAGIVLTQDAMVYEELRQFRCSHGGCLDPFAAWLAIRGLQTLSVRMERSSSTAMQIAQALSSHRDIDNVYYPGLLAPKQRPSQMRGGGAVVTFRISPNRAPDQFLRSLAIITPAPSLGGVESLINQCATMSHSSLPAGERLAHGLDERVFRLSVGLEEPGDLLDDLQHALESAIPKRG
jgi:cystathionine beta-lyase/cystathionine gamma-synthase